MPSVQLTVFKCKCRPASQQVRRPGETLTRLYTRCQRCGKVFVRDDTARFGSADWETCNDPATMADALALLNRPISARKRRLAACWVCRTEFDWCRNPRFLEAVAVGEAYAEGTATDKDRERASQYLRDTPVRVSQDADWRSAGMWCVVPDDASKKHGGLRALTLPADWFREAFSNPFEPVKFDSEWRTSTAVGLAHVMLERRRFDLFPYLADALQDAGCEHSSVRAHCEINCQHARGCWLLDAVLGKS